MANILLVDDDPALQTMYKTALTAAGHAVTIANNGQEALDSVTLSMPDVILLDMQMPVMDGIGFLEAFKPRSHAETKVIVLTNSGDIDVINKVIQLGAPNYIEKASVTPSAMITLVENVLKNGS